MVSLFLLIFVMANTGPFFIELDAAADQSRHPFNAFSPNYHYYKHRHIPLAPDAVINRDLHHQQQHHNPHYYYDDNSYYWETSKIGHNYWRDSSAVAAAALPFGLKQQHHQLEASFVAASKTGDESNSQKFANSARAFGTLTLTLGSTWSTATVTTTTTCTTSTTNIRVCSPSKGRRRRGNIAIHQLMFVKEDEDFDDIFAPRKADAKDDDQKMTAT